MEIDSTDRLILEILQNTGRMTNRELAKKVGLSPAPCWHRVKRLEQTGMINHYVAVLDNNLAGQHFRAMIGVNLSPATDPGPVAEYFRDRPETIYVMRVAGRYDMLVEVICKTPTELLAFLDTHIHSWDAIASVEPLIGLGMYKSLLKWEGQPADVDAAPAAVFKETGK